MIKILTIIGARPQFIKAAAISRAIRNYFVDALTEVIVHTGQHYDSFMSEIFFTELDVPREKYNLKVGSHSHAVQTANMMVQLEKILLEEKPHAILVYGDTNSTLASALVASKMNIPVIHVEAGIRGYNKELPEEMNRVICDHLSTLLFVPTIAGIEALEKENIRHPESFSSHFNYNTPGVFLSGDIMYDNILYFSQKVGTLAYRYFDEYNLPKDNYVLATLHRSHNTDHRENLEQIFEALLQITVLHNKPVIFPIHPRTMKAMKEFGLFDKFDKHPHLHIVRPASFLEIIALQKNCDLVLTDSGGLQKESYFLEKPCIILLEETPWIELVEGQTAKLAGSNYDKILEAAQILLTKKDLAFPPLYGEGQAAKYICERIIQQFTPTN